MFNKYFNALFIPCERVLSLRRGSYRFDCKIVSRTYIQQAPHQEIAKAMSEQIREVLTTGVIV